MKKKLIIVSVLILITLPTLLPYFNTKFFYTQDYIFIARLNQMNTALQDGHFPVRWVPDLRYGEPIFNFYAPLPYYLGVLIHLIGFNFIWVSKILFILSSILSAITMYILVEKINGNKAGFLSAILYTYAPYRAVDMYVRGSLSETWAFVFFPLIFYASWQLMEKFNLKRIVFLSLSLAGLFLTHNVTTLIFIPFLFLWWIYLTLRAKQRKIMISLIGAFVLALGLSAFFILPAVFERDFIQTKYLIVGYFDFRAHFVAVKQFFSLFWGYGSSLWGLDDGLSFQVGLANWVILGLATILGIIHRRDRKLLGLLFFLAVSLILSLFLQHNKSAFIWEALPLMAFIQFPWRFLAISVFIIPLVSGAIMPYLNKIKIIYFILIAVTIVSTIGYFRPKEYVDDSFFDKFLNKDKMRQGIDLTKDYLPIWVQTTSENFFNTLFSEKGEIQVIDFKKKTAYSLAKLKVLSDESIIVAPITYFPGWKVLANENNINLEQPSDQGLIRFRLPKGDYKIKFEFADTPVRMIGNFVSLSSLLFILLILFKYKRKAI